MDILEVAADKSEAGIVRVTACSTSLLVLGVVDSQSGRRLVPAAAARPAHMPRPRPRRVVLKIMLEDNQWKGRRYGWERLTKSIPSRRYVRKDVRFKRQLRSSAQRVTGPPGAPSNPPAATAGIQMKGKKEGNRAFVICIVPHRSLCGGSSHPPLSAGPRLSATWAYLKQPDAHDLRMSAKHKAEPVWLESHK